MISIERNIIFDNNLSNVDYEDGTLLDHSYTLRNFILLKIFLLISTMLIQDMSQGSTPKYITYNAIHRTLRH